MSKILLYERPYDVIGIIEPTGLKEAPKDICKARFIGTSEAGNAEETQLLRNICKDKLYFKAITCINPSESEGMVPMKQ